MAEFAALSNLKNVLLAPLTKVSLQVAPTALPRAISAASASTQASRHDHHNIEVKTVSELGDSSSSVETDLYLFIPRSFEIGSSGKNELVKDYRSRIRLALPVSGEQGGAALESAINSLALSMQNLEDGERSGESVLSLSHPLCEEVLEATKDLCAIISETLKHGSSEHPRQFFLSHTLMTTASSAIIGIEVLVGHVTGIHDMILKVREITSSKLPAAATIFGFLDEYVSQLYVLYLGTIRSELEKIEGPKENIDRLHYARERLKLERLLDRHQEEEARYRSTHSGLHSGEAELDREQRLVRLSHLKKFFQSKTFIDVTREQSAQRISESTATIGTAMAAFAAAMLERFSRSGIGDVAVNGVLVISLGVIFYVVRDRLKDKAKIVFHEKALKYLPDFEQQLMAKDKKIGRVREWFRLYLNGKVPKDVLAFRQGASTTEMEKRLPEDVFHCHKIQEVHASLLMSNHKSPSKALLENTRINFERYLKHMDDPFKELTELDATGQFKHELSHRVYHFYLYVKTVSRPLNPKTISRLRLFYKTEKTPGVEQMRLYRIVLDKTGVLRLEDLSPTA